MTLDDLKAIDSQARDAKRHADSLRYHAQALGKLRNLDSADDMVDAVLKGLVDGWSKFDATPREAVRAVFREQLGDMLRIAELRLEAQARSASARHRLLTEQVRGFFDEEAQP